MKKTTVKRGKYNNKKTNGYHSKVESEHAVELRLLQKGGYIKDLREQVKYQLIPPQYIDGKCVERGCSYIADFVYNEGGKTVVVDVKGVRTPEYVIKRKLMLLVHKIKIKEV